MTDPAAAAVVRRNVLLLRTTARDLHAAMEARSAPRLKRLTFDWVKSGADTRGPLMEAVRQMRVDLRQELSHDQEEAPCIQAALKDLLSLADAIAGFAAYAEAEGPVRQPVPVGEQGVEVMDAWHMQLELAASTSKALVQCVLPVCSDAAQQGRILAAAAAALRVGGPAIGAAISLYERSAAWQAMSYEFHELMEEWTRHQCKLARDLLGACDGRHGTPPAAADAAAQALSPGLLVAWLRALAPVLDTLAATVGLAACTCVAPLTQLLTWVLRPCNARLQPHAEALVEDWPLVEGCIRLLTAAHTALLAAPAWQPDLEYKQVWDWGSKHEALVVDWPDAWQGLLRHAEAAGRQHEALAPLAVAASTMLSGEAELLASLPLQLVRPAGSEQWGRNAAAAFDKAAEHLNTCWSASIMGVGFFAAFLVEPVRDARPTNGRSAWKAFQQLARTSTAVVRCCSQAQPPSHPKLLAARAAAVKLWAGHTASVCAQLKPEHADQAAAAPAAMFAHNLLQLLHLQPKLTRALNGCTASPSCRCSLCGGGGRLVLVGSEPLVLALTGSLRAAGHSAMAGQQAAGTAALARLFSACTSLCHLWAGLNSQELELCFGGQPTSQASDAAAGASAAATTAAHMATRVIQAALQLLWPALLESKPVERGGEAGRQWDRQYVCAMVETAAALAAIEAIASEEQAVPAGRERVLARLGRLSEAVASDQDSDTEADGAADAAEAQPLDEAAVLGRLAAPLLDPAAAEALPQLLRRLLPPAEAGQDGSGGAAAALPPVSAEAAVLQAEALATRKLCSYVRCPNLAAASSSHARGKRCARCIFSRYDSATCQRADWSGLGGAPHKQACAALVAAAAEAAD